MIRLYRLSDIMTPEHNSFGVIRMAMAMAVLVSHSYFFVTGDATSEPLMGWTGRSLGEHAVQVFFFLSGILVTESLARSRGLVDFATSRVLRIFPGLVVCVVLTAVLLGPLVTSLPASEYWGGTGVLAYLVRTVLLTTGAATLPGVFNDLPAAGLVNLSLWTLKYEAICYIGLGLIGATGLVATGRGRLLLAALAAIVLLAVKPVPSPDGIYSFPEHIRYFALYFGTGMIAALLKQHILIAWPVTIATLAIYTLVLGTAWTEVGCVLFIGAATLQVATWSFGPLRDWTNRNDLSYGVYIYAAPLQQAIFQMAPGLGAIGLSVASLAPVLVLAHASWSFIERPAMRQRRSVAALLRRTGLHRLWGSPGACAVKPDVASRVEGVLAQVPHDRAARAIECARPSSRVSGDESKRS